MKRLIKYLIPLSLLALAGCVVVPGRYHYYGPRVYAVAPAPVIVMRP